MLQLTITTPASCSGLLADICHALAGAGVNILDIDIVEDRRKGVIVLHAVPDDVARRVLEDEGFTVETRQTLVLELPDEQGAIVPVADLLKDHAINVRSMHVLHRVQGGGQIAIHTDNDDAAREVLRDYLAQ